MTTKTQQKPLLKRLGIIDENDSEDHVLTGAELNELSEKNLKSSWPISLFMRVSPEHKVRIVKACKIKGKVVAMTGDGVNDALL